MQMSVDTGVKDAIAQPVLAVVPEIAALKGIIHNVYDWATVNILSVDFLVQCAVILALFLAARMAARKTENWLEVRAETWKRHSSFLPAGGFFHLARKEILFLMFLPVFMWVAALLAVAAKAPSVVLSDTAVLTIVWTIIRTSAGLIKSPVWSKIVAIFLWALAALNILKWMEPTIRFLDHASVSFGDARLSLLMLIKGGIFVGVLLWLTGIISEAVEKRLHAARTLNSSQQVLFSKIIKMSLFVLSIIVALNFMGINLTALAVFSGALGIGIGFGLQKVFANLISGFILLMDKSIKPGDVIAIGNTFGWVNRLSTRYVSILTRDGIEHLIPNENLITGQVENWSHSNSNIRLSVPVGVAYHSDRREVKALLLKAVKENPRVLRHPEPICLLVGFGDNSVNFELLFWINDPANGVTNIKSDVYEVIFDLFLEHGVEFPFPQRDIHIKSGSL